VATWAAAAVPPKQRGALIGPRGDGAACPPDREGVSTMGSIPVGATPPAVSLSAVNLTLESLAVLEAISTSSTTADGGCRK